jgi:hypothetical protein
MDDPRLNRPIQVLLELILNIKLSKCHQTIIWSDTKLEFRASSNFVSLPGVASRLYYIMVQFEACQGRVLAEFRILLPPHFWSRLRHSTPCTGRFLIGASQSASWSRAPLRSVFMPKQAFWSYYETRPSPPSPPNQTPAS